jgi:tetratricopeptide (TPR) repeat protein
MTPSTGIGQNGPAGAQHRYPALGLLLIWATLSYPAMAATPPAVKHNSAQCLAHGGMDVCNDAIRWNPSDPALLVALGDAEYRAGRTADALRHYRRAADLAPNTKGLNAKITAADARLHPKRAPPPRHAAASNAPSEKQYSNAAPLTQSH